LPPNYRSTTATAKQNTLLARCRESEYAVPPSASRIRALGRTAKKLLPTNLARSLVERGDIRPRGDRGPKILHDLGVVNGGVLTLNNRTFPVVIRSSLALRNANKIVPGLALKILRDGDDSINLPLMDSPLGQGQDRNFFARTFANEFPMPTFRESKSIWFLGKAFALVNRQPNFLPIPADLRVAAGIPANARNISLRHTSAANRLLRSDSTNDVLQALREKLQPGLRISEVFIGDIHVGTLTITTPATASFFGDRHLFFRHTTPIRPWVARLLGKGQDSPAPPL